MISFRLPFTLLLIVLIAACVDNSDKEIVIQGVINDATGNALENATVQITSPQNLSNIFSRSNTEGSYSLGGIIVESVTDVSITAAAIDFVSQTKVMKIAPGDDIIVIDFELTPENDEGDDGDDDDGGSDRVTGTSGGAAALILESVQRESINIAETGGIVSTAFTFQVQDSSGREISTEKAVEVELEIIQGPADASIMPTKVTTNSTGRITANLFAGNTAGVVMIQAKVTRTDLSPALILQSTPVAFTIHGGFPDLDHFSMSISTHNFEGFAVDGVRNSVSVVVGDKFSNPVKPKTAVYFKTIGGIIQGSGMQHTDVDGQVSVDLISGGDRNLLNHPVLGFGYASITAITINENNDEISREIPVLFSGPPSASKITLNPATFTIPANGAQTFELTVTDINDNPLPAETVVTIEVADGLEVTGGDIEIPNALLPGPGVTVFTFTVADVDDLDATVKDTNITIRVETPLGAKASRSDFVGTRAKAIN